MVIVYIFVIKLQRCSAHIEQPLSVLVYTVQYNNFQQ